MSDRAEPCLDCKTRGGAGRTRLGLPTRIRGLCHTCYTRRLRNGRELPPLVGKAKRARGDAPVCLACGTTGGSPDPRRGGDPFRARGLCNRCYRAWRRAERPDMEAFLADPEPPTPEQIQALTLIVGFPPPDPKPRRKPQTVAEYVAAWKRRRRTRPTRKCESDHVLD